MCTCGVRVEMRKRDIGGARKRLGSRVGETNTYEAYIRSCICWDCEGGV